MFGRGKLQEADEPVPEHSAIVFFAALADAASPVVWTDPISVDNAQGYGHGLF